MRGSLKQRAKGSWSIILDLGYEADPVTGLRKRKQQWTTFHGTRKKAEDKLTELLETVRTGMYVDPSTLTLGQWLTTWIDLVQPTIRPASHVRYKGIVENHLAKATIATMPLQKLRSSHVEAYYATIPAGSRPLHHTVLRRALRKATKERLLVANPAADLDHTPRRRRGADDGARINCWTAAEAKTFLAAAKAAGAQAAALYAVALDSGARKGELCGLAWESVDLSTGTLRIVRQLTKPGPAPTFGPPKNGCSRDVTLSAETVELLRLHKRAQSELKMANRTTYHDLGLVFAKEYGDLRNRVDLIGHPLQANNLGERQFSRLIAAAKVKRITFHGMRHTTATLLLQAGEPVHVVSKRLGHARVEITLNTYAHVLPDMQQQAAATIGALLHG
ncbi:MAG TPA: tyrosine-type recombinase/integrase [Vicinamibacterales bacterium]|jgi:integrase